MNEPAAGPFPSPSQSPDADQSLGCIRLVATNDQDLSALAQQIEPYGYRVVRVDPVGSQPTSHIRDSEILIIVARPLEPWVMSWVREIYAMPAPPALLVMDRGLEPIDRILVLEAGADDCVSSDCRPRELIARIRAVMRRRSGSIPAPEGALSDEVADMLAFGAWTIDRPQRRLMRPDGAAETLTVAEFAVLDQLLRQPRRIVSRETLLEATAPAEHPETRNFRAIDIQVSRLRKRLEIDGDQIIRTIRGRGYMLLPLVSQA